MKPSRLERAEANLSHWREQARQVERERAAMPWVLRIGLPAGVAAAVLAQPWIGAAVVALSLLTYAMGLYMTTVRRGEFAHHIRDAEAEFAAASAASRTP